MTSRQLTELSAHVTHAGIASVGDIGNGVQEFLSGKHAGF